jgi:homogentisate 1,2-dioxygenase
MRVGGKCSWLYRIRPSVCHTPYEPVAAPLVLADFSQLKPFPNQLRWSPFDLPTTPGVDFVKGLVTLCGAGSAGTRNGIAIHIYTANTSMTDTAFYNADGDFLIGACACLCLPPERTAHDGLTATRRRRPGLPLYTAPPLAVPQHGTLAIRTEFGQMEVPPNHIAVIQRGIRFAVSLPDGPVRGYVLEVFNGHFELPDLGPIGRWGALVGRTRRP